MLLFISKTSDNDKDKDDKIRMWKIYKKEMNVSHIQNIIISWTL